MRSAAAFVILIFSGFPRLRRFTVLTGLQGDVAISSTAGPVWPMKKWAYYDELKNELKQGGLKANILQSRSTVLEHLADVQGHRCLVSGDGSPIHWRWAAVCYAFRFLPARVHGKYTKHLVSIRISTHSDKMMIDDIPSRSTLSPRRLSDKVRRGMKICTR
jgi:hypothetical protein